MTRREFLLGSAAVTLAALTGCGRRSGPRRPRNVILIVSDTLRADHLGCYGSRLGMTPNVDAFARRGTLFAHAMSCAPLTGAAHASLMTGTYQTRHRVTTNVGALPEDLHTLAGVLSHAGFDTAAFISSLVLTTKAISGMDRGFATYDQNLTASESTRADRPYRDAKETTAAGLSWLEGRGRRPFFLWFHLLEPHGPYEVPDPSLLARAGELPRLPGEPASLPVLPGESGRDGLPRYQVIGQERAPARYRARYAARIGYVDRSIGQIIERVHQLGLDKDTLVVLTSDHGELLGEAHYYFQHEITLTPAVLHVPLVFVGPGVPAGAKLASLAGTVDVMPTILETLGLSSRPLDSQLQGQSLAPLLSGKTQSDDAPRYAICERTKEWSVLVGARKYTRTQQDARGRLTAYQTDAADAADAPAVSGETERMEGLLQRFIATAPDLLTRAAVSPPVMSEDEKRKLRALGYVR